MTFNDCGEATEIPADYFSHPLITKPIAVLCHREEGHDGPHLGMILGGMYSAEWQGKLRCEERTSDTPRRRE